MLIAELGEREDAHVHEILPLRLVAQLRLLEVQLESRGDLIHRGRKVGLCRACRHRDVVLCGSCCGGRLLVFDSFSRFML